MSSWATPVTDRTADDVLNRTAKAFFNVADWVRVYGNSEHVNVLGRVMMGFDVAFSPLVAPTVAQFPAADDINTLVENIDLVRVAVAATDIPALPHDYQPGGGGTSPDYLAVNAWEDDLRLLLETIIKIADDQVFCGVAAAGQPHLWQVRFRRWPYQQQLTSGWKRKPRAGIAVCGAGVKRQNRFRRLA